MTRVVLAANNGDIGGGEVMLLATARALTGLGAAVLVVGPDAPGGVLDAAEEDAHPVVRLAPPRRAYLRELRAWARRTDDWLWCHGLVPAAATAGRRRRIVHLHQEPVGAHRGLAVAARHGAAVTLVPSRVLASRVTGSEVMWNWTEPLPVLAPREPGRPVRLGFIGRHSTDKGLDVLADAVALLDRTDPGGWRLVLAGDGRFVPRDQARRVALALDRVRHLVEPLGWCDRAEFQAATDVAVFPSRWHEPFGLVAAESMSARLPCVVSDAGALPEVVGPGHPWTARRGDPTGLADAVSACVAAPTATREAVLDAARRRWEQHFSPAAGTDRVAALAARLGILG